MATIIRCDHCKGEAELDNPVMHSVPPTWIEITEHQPGSTPNGHHHVCSRGCGAALLSKPREEQPKPLSDDDIPF